MSRKKCRILAWVIVVVGIIQFLVCEYVAAKCDAEWISIASFVLMGGLIGGASGMFAKSKNEITYKNYKISEGDERLQIIRGQASKIALKITLLVNVVAAVYYLCTQAVRLIPALMAIMPCCVGLLAYWIALGVIEKKM